MCTCSDQCTRSVVRGVNALRLRDVLATAVAARSIQSKYRRLNLYLAFRIRFAL